LRTLQSANWLKAGSENVRTLPDNEKTVAFDWTKGALADGLRCYRNQEFWVAHEHWEAVWLKSDEPDKTFLQAIIQVTAAFHHLQKGNLIGHASLLERALGRLNRFPPSYGGIEVEALRESIRQWLQALESGHTSPQVPLPQIF
jgi:predicted metal-dependent hydrolase